MKQIVRVLIVVCVACACIGVSLFLHGRIRTLRDSIAKITHALAIAPEQGQRERVLQKELITVEEKLKKISSIVVSEDGLVDVVGSIVKAAQSSGVAVQVPEVSSDPTATGVLQDVYIRLNAVGSPSALVMFLYRLEHLPYLVKLSSWSLDTTQQSSLRAFARLAPLDAALPAGRQARSTPELKSGSVLAVEIVIATMKR